MPLSQQIVWFILQKNTSLYFALPFSSLHFKCENARSLILLSWSISLRQIVATSDRIRRNTSHDLSTTLTGAKGSHHEAYADLFHKPNSAALRAGVNMGSVD